MQVTISTVDKPKTETAWQKEKEEDAMNDMNQYDAITLTIKTKERGWLQSLDIQIPAAIVF